MKHATRLAAAVCAVLLSAPFAVFAQEESESPISWEIGAVSDYVWRGVSQSDENPTGQVGITYTSPIGLYVGGWASGVDFGDGDPDFEVDYFVGYGWDVSDAVNLDFMLTRYTYPGASYSNYNEFTATATFAETYSVGVSYTNDVFNSGTDGWYYSLGGQWGLPNDFSISANVGRSVFDDNDAAASKDYTDWGVSVGKDVGIVNFSLGYYGTDGNGRDSNGEWADNRVVFAIKVAK